MRILNEVPSTGLGRATVPALMEFDGSQFYCWYRKSSGIEQSRHPLVNLGTYGFPTPKIEEGQTLNQAAESMAETIQREQVRFLNRRGVRVPLSAKELSSLGYEYLDFQKASDDPEKVAINLVIDSERYSVRLNKYLQFDFSGRTFPDQHLHDALRLTVLSYLYPIICNDQITTEYEESSDTEIEIRSRMGHLRFLPEGSRFYEMADGKLNPRCLEAIDRCLRYEGRDLQVLNTMRRLSRGTTRDSTYVRPVIETGENLPPIELHLPNPIQY